MADREFDRIHRKAYSDGWVQEPPDGSAARGCAIALLISATIILLLAVLALWWQS